MEELILKYLQGNLNESEEIKLKLWLQENIENRKAFENIVGNWKVSEVEVMNAKTRVLQRIQSQNSNWKSSKGLGRWKYFSAAAILIIGLTISFLWQGNTFTEIGVHSNKGVLIVEKEANLGQKLTFELPDGSIVKLNAGSKITFPKTFSSETREVELVGEAFFDVRRDENRPFHITSDNVNIEVLGTSFNVKSYPNENEVAVSVKTGRVSVESRNTDENLILIANEMAVYTREDKLLIKEEIRKSQVAFGWTEKKLAFENQSIEEIFKLMSRWYGVDFYLEKTPDLNKKFSGSYNNLTLNAVLGSLSFAYDFKYEIDEKNVTIK
ncbi:MAG: FecR domain-containing protein [Cyclobacteriaceae bacterium]